MGDQDWEDGERTRRVRFRALGLFAATLTIVSSVGLALGAATPTGAAITPMRALHGNNAPVPPGATPIGPAPGTDTLPLTVTLQPRNPAALALEVQAVSSPTSPEYRDFLTPAQFASQFGATPATIAAVTSSLRNEGLTVGPPTAGGLAIPVSGTVAQEEAAFSTPITKYKLSSGKTGYHNDTAPKVPATVAPQIQGVLGLDTLTPPKPQTTLPQAATGVAPPAAPASSPALAPGQPSACSSVTSTQSLYTGALNAEQLAQAYSFGPLYSSNDYGGGTTIALLEMQDAGYSSSDISTFATCYGITLGGGQITEKSVSSGADVIGGGTIEAELDIETALSLAPKANIDVYEAGNSDSIYSVFSKIVNDDLAKIVSASWTNGCEAYQPATSMSSENTLFQQAAAEGQSVFVASGDQGSEGCNINGQVSATTGSTPVAQAVDPSTGTLYIANQGNASVSVDSEGDGGNSTLAASVSVGSSPDAVALDSTDKRVFVANRSSNSLSEFSSNTCNDTTTSGCGTTTPDTSGISSPRALAMSGTTLYVGNGNGTVAVYNASSNALAATVTLPSGTVPTAVAVDATNGFVYVADGTNNRVAYFSSANCNEGSTSGCSTTPSTTTVKTDPVALAVDGSAGNLYVANAGNGGGISVISLSTHAVTTTISTGSPSVTGIDGVGLVESIGLSPDGNEVLAVLHNLTFPGDVLATISPSTNAITATANLQTSNDTMGQLVSDGASSRDYVWVTDETAGGDMLQNLSLAVSDPASQPYLTAVGGTSLPSGSLGPPPTESTWNDQLNFAEGAGGGGLSDTFAMPSYQQSYGGVVTGSSGTPCGNSGGYCREVPDVSADADPNTGYIVYDAANGDNWVAIGGTSGAAPLWAAVTAVAASSKNVTTGFGLVNPDLYYLAQTSPGTYLNDVTAGNNDFNAANGGSYSAMTGYDMATGLGTPITSALAGGMTTILVAVSGTQTYGGSPSFTPTPSVLPSGITLSGSLSCTTVGSSTSISSTLSVGSYTLLQSSCSGVTPSGTNASNYSVAYTSAANDFTVKAAPVNVAVSGSQTYGGTPTFHGTDTPPSGITVNTASLTCTTLGVATTIAPTVAAGTYTLIPNSCSNATLSGINTADYTVNYTAAPNDFTVNQAPLTITASSGTMTYGGTVPTITASYSPFVNGQTHANLTTQPTCSTAATSSSPVLGSPFSTGCAGAVDPNYAISYTGGTITVSAAPLTITASSPSMQFGSAPPTITPQYSGFVNNDSASSLNPQPTCSTTATSSSPVSPPTYPSSCSGAADPNYSIGYVAGSVTVTKATIAIAVSGSQTYGSSTPIFSGADTPPTGVTVTTTNLACTTVGTSTPIGPTLTVTSSPYTLLFSSCSGATLSGLNSSDYTIVYTSANNDFVVNPDPLTVTASSGTMTYGGTVPTITAGYSTFANGQNQSAFTTQPTCTTTATNTSTVAGSPYASSCSGAVDPNYNFTYVPGTVTVTTTTIDVVVSGSQSFGGSATFNGSDSPPSGVTVTTTSVTCTTVQPSTTISASLPVGSYTLVGTTCTGATLSGPNSPNYVIAYTSATNDFTVLGSTIPVSVSGSQTYGSSAPAFSGSDSPPLGVTVNTTGLTCTTVGSTTLITNTLPVGTGTYTLLAGSTCTGVTLGGPNASNYSVQYTSTANDFTVNPDPLTVTASSGTMTYGGTVPTITAGYSTFANGQNQSAFTTQPTCTTTATNSSPVSGSPYASTCSGAVDSNYAFTYVAGSVTMTPAPLQITAASVGVPYGSAVPTITPLPTGFVNGDTLASLTTQPTCSTNYNGPPSPSPVSGSPYQSTCSGAVDANYTISYFSGQVSVSQAPIGLTVSGSQTYGSSTPIFSGAATPPTGVTVTTTNLTCTTVNPTTSIAPTLAVTTYTLAGGSTCSGATLSGSNAPNYQPVYVGGTNGFIVNPAPLMVTASSPSMMYGSTPPAITAGYTGWVNGQNSTALSTTPTCSTTATASSSVASSPYTSTCSGAVDPNYAMSYTPGSVTVTKYPLIITASNGNFEQGGTPPAISPLYSTFPSGKGPSSLTTQPACSTTATSSSGVGSYPSTCSGASSGNYNISYVAGQVSVSPDPPPPPPPPPPTPSHGYWLVGSDGGIFTFGSANFYGSTGNIRLQRPVVGITPTQNKAGYWLVASDGGIFAFGNAGFYGSIPGQGLHPAGSGLQPSLNAPIVAMVPSADGGGYFMVASDGGVFAFGDARFSGSCPGIGGCSGAAVAVVPDASGNGYWLVTQTGHVYAFGDAPANGAPGPQAAAVTSAVRTSDGNGYYILLADGTVYAYGDAVGRGGPSGVGGLDPASAIFTDSGGGGYWVATSMGAVYTFGDAPNDGSMAGTALNGSIIAAAGF